MKSDFWNLKRLSSSLFTSIAQALADTSILGLLYCANYSTSFIPDEFSVPIKIAIFLYLLFFFSYFVSDSGFEFWERFSHIGPFVKVQRKHVIATLVLIIPPLITILSFRLIDNQQLPMKYEPFLALFNIVFYVFMFIFYKRDAVFLSTPPESARLIYKAFIYAGILTLPLVLLYFGWK